MISDSLQARFRAPRAALSRAVNAKRVSVRTSGRESGFTLLEILTAMALFFMVAGILVSGVSQAIRVADVGATESANSRDQAMRLAWFRETIGLTVLPPRNTTKLEEPPPLIGDARRVAALSIAVPNSPSHGPVAYRFEIAFNPNSGESELRLTSGADSINSGQAGTTASGVLASWRGSGGRFFYLDEDGVWQDQWPVNNPSKAAPNANRSTLVSPLPKAIELRYGEPAKSIVVAVQDRSIPPPTFAELSR